MRSKILWPTVVVVAVLVGACIPLLFDIEYYYVDDSQAGAFGQWYEIGRRFLDGDWSLINPRVWQSGNLLAEGAWGIFSPVLWGIGVLAYQAESALLINTVVKLLFLIIAGVSVFALGRNFKVAAPWAALIGVAVPLAGFTLYMDAPSWANGFMAWCMLPLAWVLARRAVFDARSPLLAVIGGAAVIGIGYAHATILLGVTLAATIVEALVARRRPAIIRAFAVATLSGLFAVIVHLPGLLTAPVTGRSSTIANSGLLTVNLSGLAASATPVGTPLLPFFNGLFPDAPLLYIAWFLPVLAFAHWGRLTLVLRKYVSIPIVLAAATVVLLLPSDFGPLRFPVRMMPYLTLAVLLIVGVALTHARVEKASPRRLIVALSLVLASAAFAFSAAPRYWEWMSVTTVLSLAGVWLIHRLVTHATPSNDRTASQDARVWRVPAAAALAVVFTLGMLLPQHVSSPVSPLPDYQVPNDVDEYQGVLDGAEGDVLVVGTAPADPDSWEHSLPGNLWYVTEADVQNAYSAVYYDPYNARVCMAYNGMTCSGAYDALFAVQPVTGLTLADLMGVSSVLVLKGDVPEESWSLVPEGWTVVEDSPQTRLIVRDEPVPGAGSVVWTSEGTDVTVLREDAMEVTFRVDQVSDDGGTVALSRIPWPGYQVDAGTLTEEPVEGFLLGVDLRSDSVGDTVTVSFRQPGSQAELFAGGLLILLLCVWLVLRHVRPLAHSRHPRISAAAVLVRDTVPEGESEFELEPSAAILPKTGDRA